MNIPLGRNQGLVLTLHPAILLLLLLLLPLLLLLTRRRRLGQVGYL